MAIALSVKEGIASTYSGANLTATTQGARFSDEHLPLPYGGAEVFLFSSLAEGFGLPVLEAMACGTPVICSDTTALPEIAAGGAACLVPALEVEARTEMIEPLLSRMQ
jgi:glycosyltransferase involved in cell wall biosynthesis